jgi:pre-60S factor REI1
MSSKKHKDTMKICPVAAEPEVVLSEVLPSSSANSSFEVVELPSKNWRSRLSLAKTDQEIDQILQEKMEFSKRLTNTDCLFCPVSSGCFEDNLSHMAKTHSFFIPDLENLSDISGLIQYLGDKISVANVCIHCNGKGKALHSTEAVQAHMISKSHCKIPFDDEDLQDIAEFYEYKVSEWQDVDGDVDGDVDMESVDDEFIAASVREEGSVYFTDSELVLSNGTKIGHRAFNRYWKQNVRSQAPLPGSRYHPEMVSRLSGNYSSMVGYNPSQFRQIIQKQLVIKERQKQNARLGDYQKKFRLGVGIRGNNQSHYRDQTGMIC